MIYVIRLLGYGLCSALLIRVEAYLSTAAVHMGANSMPCLGPGRIGNESE